MLSPTAADLKVMIAMQNIGLQVLNSWMALSYWALIPKMLSLLVKPLSDAPLSLQLIIRKVAPIQVHGPSSGLQPLQRRTLYKVYHFSYFKLESFE